MEIKFYFPHQHPVCVCVCLCVKLYVNPAGASTSNKPKKINLEESEAKTSELQSLLLFFMEIECAQANPLVKKMAEVSLVYLIIQ